MKTDEYREINALTAKCEVAKQTLLRYNRALGDLRVEYSEIITMKGYNKNLSKSDQDVVDTMSNVLEAIKDYEDSNKQETGKSEAIQ